MVMKSLILLKNFENVDFLLIDPVTYFLANWKWILKFIHFYFIKRINEMFTHLNNSKKFEHYKKYTANDLRF